jgi:AcrR family transcriptional regulator
MNLFEKTEKARWSEKDARSIRTRAAIRQSFVRLLDAKPLEQITMREIAADAGIGYTTFFRHYSSKDEILLEIVADEMRLWDEAIAKAPSRDSSALCLASCAHIGARRDVWRPLLTNGGLGPVKEALTAASFRAAEKLGPSTDWLPIDVGVLLSVGAELDLLVWWLQQPDPMPAERVAEILDRVIVGPTIRGEF